MKKIIVVIASILVTSQTFGELSLSRDLMAMEQSATYQAMVCAHRGNSYAGLQNNLPQSSIAALEQCIVEGIDMVEIDGRRTKDGVLVNLHDATIDAYTNGTGTIANMTYEEIKQYYLLNADGTPSTEYVHTVREMFQAAKNRIYVVVDMKEGAIGCAMADIAAELDMIDQVMWYFPNSEKAGGNAIYKKYPDAILMPYSSSASFLQTLHGRYSPLYIFHTAVEKMDADAALRTKFEEYDMVAYANCLNHDNEIASGNTSYLDRMVNHNIRFIQSDRGDKVIQYLEQHGYRYQQPIGSGVTASENGIEHMATKMMLENQQVIILRDGQRFSILGQRL